MAEGYRRLIGVLIVLLALLGVTTLGGADDGAGADIESSAPTMVPAGQAAAEPSTTSAGPATSTTRAAVTTTTAPGPPTTMTTVACRNSNDPACGPFRFDPQPGPDNPMFVHIVVGPL
ncbi:MAG: hypothetical protein M3163_08215, partial [Actinomycetota bacterium]|nr:hypothetical protein [Actinomycetota bacterium]